MQLRSTAIIYLFSSLIIVIEARSVLTSHTDPHEVKHFESKLDENIGYWSPSTSSIDWCERNYVVTWYIAEFWNCISSFLMCILAAILILRGLYHRIEKRFLLLSLSFGLIGFGSAYFHGTLTYYGQMVDELSMVYTMIVWWFILFQMDKYKSKRKTSHSTNRSIIIGIIYGLLWTFVHSLKSFVIVFQIHFTMMVIGGIVKLIYLSRQTQHQTRSIRYLLGGYIGFWILASICWITDQQLCERMNSINGFNPQFHAWWHILIAFDFHLNVVCTEAMRFLSIKYQRYQTQVVRSSKQPFKPEDHLHIVFYFGLPFVNYSKDEPITKNQ